MNDVQQRKAAKDFAARWNGKGYEKGESQLFWTTLLTDVFGVSNVVKLMKLYQKMTEKGAIMLMGSPYHRSCPSFTVSDKTHTHTRRREVLSPVTTEASFPSAHR